MGTNNQIIIYQTDDDQTQIDVRLENETVWLTTQQMAMLFDREESNIRRHVINVFKEGELKKENNVHFLHVNGVKKPTRMSRKLCAFGCDAESPIGSRLFFEIAELTKLVHYLDNQLHS